VYELLSCCRIKGKKRKVKKNRKEKRKDKKEKNLFSVPFFTSSIKSSKLSLEL